MMNLVNELSVSLGTAAALASGLSTFVKAAWAVVLVWSVAQVATYSRCRVPVAAQAPAVRKTVRRKPARKRPAEHPRSGELPVVVSDLGMSVHASADTYR